MIVCRLKLSREISSQDLGETRGYEESIGVYLFPFPGIEGLLQVLVQGLRAYLVGDTVRDLDKEGELARFAEGFNARNQDVDCAAQDVELEGVFNEDGCGDAEIVVLEEDTVWD